MTSPTVTARALGGAVSPQRIQLSRRHRLPLGARSVARPTRWGNPFRVGDSYWWADEQPCPYPGADEAPAGERVKVRDGVVLRLTRCDTVEQAVDWHRAWITAMQPGLVAEARTVLAGRDLACWCKPGRPCHADNWIALANQPAELPA